MEIKQKKRMNEFEILHLQESISNVTPRIVATLDIPGYYLSRDMKRLCDKKYGTICDDIFMDYGATYIRIKQTIDDFYCKLHSAFADNDEGVLIRVIFHHALDYHDMGDLITDVLEGQYIVYQKSIHKGGYSIYDIL